MGYLLDAQIAQLVSFQLFKVSGESLHWLDTIPPDPELPPLRMAMPPTGAMELPPVGDGDGFAFEMLTFFI